MLSEVIATQHERSQTQLSIVSKSEEPKKKLIENPEILNSPLVSSLQQIQQQKSSLYKYLQKMVSLPSS
ncbi:hypothetical protein FGO68_gene12989 [Halteria grandinella]|uniref:Uncharacterized protein n=1 Tax=Halteria grandinella TaxID=5974 RepID=A0A8J8NCJ2_HALGN|nr:hypothetical protein FGO68_gene12989 [Halteria grandinella]